MNNLDFAFTKVITGMRRGLLEGGRLLRKDVKGVTTKRFPFDPLHERAHRQADYCWRAPRSPVPFDFDFSTWIRKSRRNTDVFRLLVRWANLRE